MLTAAKELLVRYISTLPFKRNRMQCLIYLAGYYGNTLGAADAVDAVNELMREGAIER